SSRRRHTRWPRDWSSDVCSSDLPQGCDVTSFKAPSTEELAHDYLWRVHRAAPYLGNIGIFNRSHYEDVLIVRVHDLVPQQVWQRSEERRVGKECRSRWAVCR